MARNAGGTYTLPAGNPVVTGTVIASSWANTTLSDIAAEMTDSLDRSGKGGMLAPLLLADGAVGTPGVAFVSEPSTGMYRAAANDLRFAVAGVDAMRVTPASAAPRFTFTSPQAGAGTQTDFVFNTTNARTAGNIFDVQEAGASRLTISNTGVVTAALGIVVTAGGATVTAGGLTVTAGGATISAGGLTSTGQTLTTSDLAAASALTDVTLNTLNTRTAGRLLDVQNNTSSRFNVNFDGTFQHISLVATGSTGTDFFFNTTARTAGLILDVQRGGSTVFNETFDGRAVFTSRQAAAGANQDFLIAPGNVRTAGNIFEIDNSTALFVVDFAGRTISAQRTPLGAVTYVSTPCRFVLTADVSAATAGTFVNFGPAINIAVGKIYRISMKLIISTSVGTINTDIKILGTTVTGTTDGGILGSNQNATPGTVAQGNWSGSALPAGNTMRTGTASPASQRVFYYVDVLIYNVTVAGTVQFSISPTGAGTSTLRAASWIDFSEDSA